MRGLTREQLEARKEKAVRFLENVLHDPKRADEIREESLEDYQNRGESTPATQAKWCRGAESNCLRRPFQGRALPVSYPGTVGNEDSTGACR